MPIELIPHDQVIACPSHFKAKTKAAFEAVMRLRAARQIDLPEYKVPPEEERFRFYGEDSRADAFKLDRDMGVL